MTFDPTPNFLGEMADQISNQLNQICLLNKLQGRRAWRDLAITKLSDLKKEMMEKK